MQTVLKLLYPSQCLTCGEMVEEDGSLCGTCWRDASFIRGTKCSQCGVPLPGEEDSKHIRCDDCIRIARPWTRGAAALMYRGTGRRLALSLKYGDRTDLAPSAAKWMLGAFGEIPPETVVVPVPLHWRRFLKRRYNQAALLAQEISKIAKLDYVPDALFRSRPTKPLDGHKREARFIALQDAIAPNPKMAKRIEGKPVLLIDDVMTSGATLGSCAEACLEGGADHVNVLVLARVAKDA
ncbi:MAG: double zinc ribbon domain-containing protein [Litoreibacter sp.]|nr:double zinc ribbon domain-containing protein [Litoreibacter sp.]MCY4335362.1 double zinc ribbon domain-containing protein [Litoreibacter sp.]